MTTPQREDIITKAFELNMRENHRISTITPTEVELKENGDILRARDALMRSNTNTYKDYIEAEARSLGLIKDDFIDLSKYDKSMTYDISEQMKGNTLITGCNQVGKSRLAMLLAHILRKNGISVCVFDNANVWRRHSDINGYTLVPNVDKFKVTVSRNHIYDISLLRPSTQRKFVNQLLEIFWCSSINSPQKTPQVVVLEEMQLYARHLRGLLSESIYRLMSVGANQKLRIIGICPDLALLDSAFIRLATQRFHFRLAVEENSLRKFRRYYGNDFTKIVQELEVGYCLHYLKGKLKIVKVPLFQKERIEVVMKQC